MYIVNQAQHQEANIDPRATMNEKKYMYIIKKKRKKHD